MALLAGLKQQMTKAICIRCGATKTGPQKKCRICGLKPSTDEEKARSVILSGYYEIDQVVCGKAPAELTAISESIKRGQAYEFDQKEVDKIIGYVQETLDVPSSTLAWDTVKLFGPIVLVIAAAIALFLIRD